MNLLSHSLIAALSLPLMSRRLLEMPMKMSSSTFIGIITVLDLDNKYLGPLSTIDNKIMEIQKSLGRLEAQIKHLVNEIWQAMEGGKAKWRFDSIVFEKLNLVESNYIYLVKFTSKWGTDEPGRVKYLFL